MTRPPKLAPIAVIPMTLPLLCWNHIPTSLPAGRNAPPAPKYWRKLSAYQCHSSVIRGRNT